MTAPTHPAPTPLAWMQPDVREAYLKWASHGANTMTQEAFAAGWEARGDAEEGGNRK